MFTFPVRVYYEDTDAGGVVYHAQYLNFFERCRTEWLRQLGYEQDELRTEQNTLFVVSSLSINYLQPALFNQQLNVTTEVTELGASRLIMKQQIIRQSDAENNEVLAQGSVTLACLDSSKFRPKRIPLMIRESLLITEAKMDSSNAKGNI
jgi:acyl-CoA thioester hydrolase